MKKLRARLVLVLTVFALAICAVIVTPRQAFAADPFTDVDSDDFYAWVDRFPDATIIIWGSEDATDSGWQTEDPAFDTANPYDGRDPRFAMTVLANGMAFKGSVIETFVGGADYSETRSDLGSPTGYYLRKYIQESTSFVPDQEVSNKHARIVFRYAEAILSYAEAANEYFRDPDGKDGTLTLSAREAINLVRANAGMPDVEATSYQEFQEAVRREWRVEFAFEDHRFWDIRRWKIGADTQVQIDGVNIEKNGTELTWSRKSVENIVLAGNFQ